MGPMLEHRRCDDAAGDGGGAERPNGDRLRGHRRTGEASASEQLAQRPEPAGAGERRVRGPELRAQAAAGAEEERLDGRGRHGEARRDLLVGEAAHVAQQHGLALLGRECGERLGKLRAVLVADRLDVHVR